MHGEQGLWAWIEGCGCRFTFMVSWAAGLWDVDFGFWIMWAWWQWFGVGGLPVEVSEKGPVVTSGPAS